jgi:hypothetical protein
LVLEAGRILQGFEVGEDGDIFQRSTDVGLQAL